MIMNHLQKAALLAVFVLFPFQQAAALVCTATMTDMNFGNVTVINNQNVDITGTVSINCTGANANQQLRFCIHLCEGSGGMDNTDINPRYMNNTAGTPVQYFFRQCLYADMGRTRNCRRDLLQQYVLEYLEPGVLGKSLRGRLRKLHRHDHGLWPGVFRPDGHAGGQLQLVLHVDRKQHEPVCVRLPQLLSRLQYDQ